LTDATIPALPADGEGKPTFQIVPTLDGYLELAEQVAELQAQLPAAGGTGGSDLADDDIDDLHDRLNRHRRDIDQTRNLLNDLIRYLDTLFGKPAPGGNSVAPAPMVSAQDTIQPQRRDLIQ
jgi:hypothetical protein